MLSKEEILSINDMLNNNGEKNEKLCKKISLIVKQLEIMQKSQEEVAKVQDEIIALEGDENGKKEN